MLRCGESIVYSLNYLPLKFKNTLLGVITVQSFNSNAYSNLHVNIFKNLDSIFDCEGYIFNLNDELYLLNYFYISDLEYKI